MIRRITALTVVLAVSAGAPTFAEDRPQSEPQAQQATVVKKKVKRPPRTRTRVVRFTPKGNPTPWYVFHVILPYEAARWGANLSTLSRRVNCESHGKYWAANGKYRGIGQFAYSTFTRGLGTIRSLRVRLVDRDVIYRRSIVTRYWSDGRIDRWKGRRWPIRVTRIYKGKINPYWTHAWAQARIMAQANAGISAVHDSEWECR